MASPGIIVFISRCDWLLKTNWTVIPKRESLRAQKLASLNPANINLFFVLKALFSIRCSIWFLASCFMNVYLNSCLFRGGGITKMDFRLKIEKSHPCLKVCKEVLRQWVSVGLPTTIGAWSYNRMISHHKTSVSEQYSSYRINYHHYTTLWRGQLDNSSLHLLTRILHS